MTLMDKLFELNKKLYSAHTGVGFGVIASSKQTVVLPVGGWVELARTTLGSTASILDVGSLADKRYLQILFYRPSGGANGAIRSGNSTVDTGTNYARRNSRNGAAESTAINQSEGIRVNDNAASSPNFTVAYYANLSAKEKLLIAHTIERMTAGAGTPPNRNEAVGKHAFTSNPLDIIQMNQASMPSGTQMIINGWDPADTHTNNFWEELDTNSGASIDLSFTGKKYLWLQFYLKATGGTLNPRMRIGNTTVDSGTNYANRGSSNGGADATSINQTFFDILGITLQTGESMFGNCFIINNASNEKLVILHSVSNNGSGAGNAPDRFVYVGKLADTTNLMDVLQITKNSGTGTQDTSSFAKIWGSN